MNTWTVQQNRQLPVLSAALAVVGRESVVCGKPESGKPNTRRWRP